MFNILIINWRKVSINLGGFKVGMAEPFTDFVEAYALLGEAGCEGVAEVVPAARAFVICKEAHALKQLQPIGWMNCVRKLFVEGYVNCRGRGIGVSGRLRAYPPSFYPHANMKQ